MQSQVTGNPFRLTSDSSASQAAATSSSLLSILIRSQKVNAFMRTTAVASVAVLLLIAAITTPSLAVPISTGLSLQYDGTNLTTNGSGEVTTWFNQGSLAAEGDLTPRIASAIPTLGVAALNGHNVVNYLGRAQEVMRSSATPFTTPLAQANQLFIVSQHTGANEAVLFDGRIGASGRHFMQMKNSGIFHVFAGSSVQKGSGAIKNEYKIYTTQFDGINTTIHTDGALTYTASPSSIGTQALGSVSLGNSDPNGSTSTLALNGQIAEVLFYDTPLNSVESRITENYLSSKYNVGSTPSGGDITLGGNDLYAGDLNANGDFDVDVFGVGNDGTSSLTAATSGALSLAESGSTMGSGEFLLAGHDGTAHGLVPAEDQPGDRWARSYYLDQTGDFDATLTFDFGDAGLALPEDNAILSLLYSDSNAPFTWSELGNGSLVGDEVQFLLTGSQIVDGFYTLGIAVPIPEPSSLLLLGISALGLVRHTRQRRRRGH